jgi:hypothetical protein
MTRVPKRLVFGVVLLLVGVGAAYAWNSFPSAKRWEVGYEKISEGDSESKVLTVLGQPTEVKDCFASQFGSNAEIRNRCAKEYWYIAILQEWVYVIDGDGKVIAKWHSVSQ